ncbi:MAG: hypothetical protein EXR74_09990 [Bdellovibrionales bacterium]|nr:hypothetical protein [Bdellovibrionales bacterium]
MEPITFQGNILFVGYGAVAQCTLPILEKHLKVNLNQISVLDFEDRKIALEPWIAKGLTFVRFVI